MQKSINPEVAVFGSSVALVHFDPTIINSSTGLTCFNFGLDGTPLIQYKGLLEEFSSFSKSKFVVISIAFDEFANRQQIQEIYKFLPYMNSDRIYKSLYDIDPKTSWRAKYIPFYSFTLLDKYFYSYSTAGLKGTPSKLDPYEINGFVPVDRSWDAKKQNIAKPFQVEISSKVVAQFKEVIDFLNSKKIRVVLVLSPVYKTGQSMILNLSDVRLQCENLIRGDNTFYDFTKDSVCENQTYFYNYSHLNRTGAKVFSEKFAAMLKNL